ncbi:hypothetical protein LCGC14_1416950 [marine sediment metagenome]|uniref:Response regulatory domain-containing protein n=1 Tax=marine sediment metagenome TaxID=412755 RepID=A0A0F9JSK8_9ZZZZ
MSVNGQNEEMRRYEVETGKKAIWHDVITKGFRNWQKGEKIYKNEKERFCLLLSSEIKKEWQNFVKNNEFSTISKLIRKSVEFFIENYQNFENYAPDVIHELKEPLTTIKGFSEILMQDKEYELNKDAFLLIKDIYDQSLVLEEKINNLDKHSQDEPLTYDILIVDDEESTVKLLSHYFKSKGYKCLKALNGKKALEFAEKFKPKVILLDIILPDISGYEICKKIKSDQKLKHIPIYYITAVSLSKVKEKVEITRADGYFLKPFNINEFEIIRELF